MSVTVGSLSTKKGKGDSKFPLSLWLSFLFIIAAFVFVVQHTFDNVSQLKTYAETGLAINDLKSKVQSIGYQVNRALGGDSGALNGINVTRASADQDLSKIEAVGIDTSKVKSDLQILDTYISPLLNQKNDIADRAKAATTLANAFATLKSNNYSNWNQIAFTGGIDQPQVIAGFHDVETAIALKTWHGINSVIDDQLDVLKKTQGTLDNLSNIGTELAPFGDSSAMSKVSSDIDSLSQQITDLNEKRTETLLFLAIIFVALLFSSIFFMRSVIFSSNETSRIRKESKNLRVINANASTLYAQMSKVVDEQGVILSPALQFERLSLTGAIYNLGSSIQKILSSAIRMIRSTEESVSQNLDTVSSSIQNTSRLQNSLNSVEQHGTIAMSATERAKESQILEAQNLKDLTKEVLGVTKNLQKLNENLNKGLTQIDGVRDTSQGISKRIKRFAETSHAMSDNTESNRDTAKQIKVLVMNAAVQSASAGAAGQRLMIIAQEIQRLSDQSVKHSERMDTLVLGMRDEVQSSIDEMETGIQLLVDTSNTTLKTYDLSKEIISNIDRIQKLLEQFKEHDAIVQEGHNTTLTSTKRILSENQSANDILKLILTNMESLKDISKQLQRLINERFPSHG
jgi:methyl-accepting chemotaxis protein